MKIKFEKLIRTLYGKMDLTWKNTAEQYGFICNGCEDNCCKSLFYHHTRIEKDYLLNGFSTLSEDRRKTVLEKADQYCDKLLLFSSPDKPFKMMCPLNESGRCLIYDFRPMICRLHGLPHELQGPGGTITHHPGCGQGQPEFTQKGYLPLDRTPFYQQMARLEGSYLKTLGRHTGRIRQTVAQMLLD